MASGTAGATGPTATGPRRVALVTCLAAVAVVLGAVLGGVAALLGLATVTAVPGLFLTGGAVVFLALNYAGAALLAVRRAPAARRRTARRAMFASSSVLLLAAFAGTALPAPAVPGRWLAVPGQYQVELATGSRLVVVRLPALGRSRRPPVIVLHGGPGIPDLAANVRTFAPLRTHGADVYLYAQLGAGASTRLADPRGYGRDRDVADLEALRARLGLDRMVLVGHSYGGALAAHYTSRHPERVAGLVLLSPGPLDPADHSANRATAGLSGTRRARLYAELLAPRALLGYTLLQVNPAAAHAYLPDAPADARNDAVLTRSAPALHCPGARGVRRPVHGSGFYALQYPQSATAAPPADPRPALTGLTIPALIIKGSCDYLSWASALDYRDRLPGARLVYLPGAGHNVQQDRPGAVLATIAAFLDGRPLPVPIYRKDRPPPGYAGPVGDP